MDSSEKGLVDSLLTILGPCNESIGLFKVGCSWQVFSILFFPHIAGGGLAVRHFWHLQELQDCQSEPEPRYNVYNPIQNGLTQYKGYFKSGYSL